MSKHPLRAILFGSLSLAMLVALAGCEDTTGALRPLSARDVVLAFGDSLTSGTGARRDESYPSVLSSLIDRTVVNGGVPGEITSSGLRRLPALLDEHQPALVILIHGGNDMLRRQPASRTAENLRAMIALVREHGADVVMMAVPRPGLLLSPAAFYGDVAGSEAVPIDDGTIARILQFPATKSDAVHPKAAGYRQMAEALADLLRAHGAIGRA